MSPKRVSEAGMRLWACILLAFPFLAFDEFRLRRGWTIGWPTRLGDALYGLAEAIAGGDKTLLADPQTMADGDIKNVMFDDLFNEMDRKKDLKS